jgi:hypothetical protein
MSSATVHLAGIVPINGQPLDFDFPWHDCMVPISKNFLAIERSILECATAGCETIWVVCPPDMQPLLKHRLGEMVQDPVWIARRHDPYPSTSKREIPIYYVESHPRDQGKRDSIPWSILYGAKIANKVCKSLSNWITPDKFYVAFPYAVYPSQHLKKYRKEISQRGNFFILNELGNSVLDGEHCGFAFDADQVGKLTKYFWDKQTGKFDNSQPSEQKRNGVFPTKLLPIEQRYSGRFFKVDEIFSQLDLTREAFKLEMEWYFDISCWENLCVYLSSEESLSMKRPKLSFLSNKTWKGIGIDQEELED